MFRLLIALVLVLYSFGSFAAGTVVKTISASEFAKANIRTSEGAGTTTLVSTDLRTQIFNLTANRIVKLPSTGVLAGDVFEVDVTGASAPYYLEVQSSDATVMARINTPMVIIAKQNTPTTPSHWHIKILTEYVYNSSASTTTDTTSFGYGIEGVYFNGYGPSGLSLIIKTCRFLTPITQRDHIFLEWYNEDGGASYKRWGPAAQAFPDTTNDGGTTEYGMSIRPVTNSLTDMNVDFASKPNVTVAWSSITNQRWRLVKVTD